MPKFFDRVSRIMRLIDDAKPDVICLQEIKPGLWPQVSRRFEKDYFVFYPKHKDVQRVKRRGPTVLHSGLIVALRKREGLKITNVEHFSYRKKRKKEFYVDRGFFVLHFDCFGKVFSVLNTHLTPYPTNLKIRLNQIHQLLDYADGLHSDFRFLVGDFNLRPESQEHALIESRGWIDTEKIKSGDDYVITWSEKNPLYHPEEPEGKLDYVWAYDKNPKWKLKEYRVDEIPVSDHYPVHFKMTF